MDSINKPIEEKFLKPMFKTVAPQTIIAFWGYVILLIAMILAMFRKPINVLSMISAVVYVGVAILSLYILNCTVIGNCKVYAWIMSYVIVSIAVIVVLLSAFSLLGLKKK